MHARFLLPDGFHVDSAGLGTDLLFTDGAAINNSPTHKLAVVSSSFQKILAQKVSHFILQPMMAHLRPIVRNCLW